VAKKSAGTARGGTTLFAVTQAALLPWASCPVAASGRPLASALSLDSGCLPEEAQGCCHTDGASTAPLSAAGATIENGLLLLGAAVKLPVRFPLGTEGSVKAVQRSSAEYGINRIWSELAGGRSMSLDAAATGRGY
jgi:hypothetical protein